MEQRLTTQKSRNDEMVRKKTNFHGHGRIFPSRNICIPPFSGPVLEPMQQAMTDNNHMNIKDLTSKNVAEQDSIWKQGSKDNTMFKS